MDEDLELNRFVRSSLEARAPLVWKGARGAIRQSASGSGLWLPAGFRRACPWAAGLLAASVVLVVALRLPFGGGTPSVEDAIGLLTEAEGVELPAGTDEAPVDLLLAWQEAALRDAGEG